MYTPVQDMIAKYTEEAHTVYMNAVRENRVYVRKSEGSDG